MNKSICLLLPLLLSNWAAKSAAKPADSWVKHFEVIPGACVVDDAEQDCIREFRFLWDLHQPQLVCIYQTNLENPLFCSRSLNEEAAYINLSLNATQEFTLVSQRNSQLQAKQTVPVYQLGQDVRRPKRRLWSVF